MLRYWLTPPAADPQFDATVTDVCTRYHEAPALATRGERSVRTDELTGVQALERKHPGLPFHDTPNHRSWLNQIEIWLSSLTRKLLRRGSFTSVDDLTAQVLAFIAHYNRTARPFKWTYHGTALVA